MAITPEDRKLRIARARWFTILVWLALLALLGRLWQLQIAEGDRLLRQSETNRLRILFARAARGVIKDREGRTIACSLPRFVVSVIPDKIKGEPDAVKRLCRILGISGSEFQSLISRKQSIKGAPVRVALNVTPDTMVQIQEQKLLLPGVSVELDQARFYPDGQTFAHVLGYLREIDPDELRRRKGMYRPGDYVGKSGLEKQYDEALHGTDGGKRVEVDARGNRTRVLGDKPSLPGKTLVLSLDRDLQKAAAVALEGKVGAAVALNPKTGEILAMVSKPSFDPNAFVSSLDPSYWAQIVNNRHDPLQNRCIGNRYPPGSTFKIVTAAAGLKHGVIAPADFVRCVGVWRLGRHPWRCWKVHGNVDFTDAIAQSCDTYFYGVARKLGGRKLGIRRLSDMAFAFGLGKNTDIDLPNEKSGRVPTEQWKKEARNESWYPGDTVNCSIGQGDVQATPLQMALVAAAIANNGKVMWPHLLKETRDRKGRILSRVEPRELSRLPISREAIDLIRDAMRQTVIGPGGTGHVVDLQGVTVAGKTGSAEDRPRPMPHAWFICFAPVENPTIAICVLREQGGHGGTEAAPVARAMLQQWFHVKGQPTQAAGQTD